MYKINSFTYTTDLLGKMPEKEKDIFEVLKEMWGVDKLYPQEPVSLVYDCIYIDGKVI